MFRKIGLSIVLTMGVASAVVIPATPEIVEAAIA
jgi:hypothetical protein